MTKYSTCDKRYKVPQTKSVRQYDDKFPEDFTDICRGRITSCPAILPSYTARQKITGSWEDPLPRVREESSAELDAEGRTTVHVRRHSWSSLSHSDFANKTLLSRKLSTESSRRSSVASVPEPIEECSSDDEINEISTYEEYMHCINCSRSGSNSSLDSSTSSEPYTNILYCYKCKHLLKQKPKPKLERRSSWNGINGNSFTNSPRRSRRSSLTDTVDLPIIKEPCFEEEDHDMKEIEDLTKKELDKLNKFNTITSKIPIS